MAVSGYIAGTMSDYLIKSGYSITSIRKIAQVKLQSQNFLIHFFHDLLVKISTSSLVSMNWGCRMTCHLFAVSDIYVMTSIKKNVRTNSLTEIVSHTHRNSKLKKKGWGINKRSHKTKVTVICCLNYLCFGFSEFFHSKNSKFCSFQKLGTKKHDILEYFSSISLPCETSYAFLFFISRLVLLGPVLHCFAWTTPRALQSRPYS